MKQLVDIFSKSPFGLLDEHMSKVAECTALIKPLSQAFADKDYEQVDSLKNRLSDYEHEADVIKDNIREHLPKSIFMPVSREDLLKLLKRQDSIADTCEDLAILYSVRKTPVHDALKADFLEFIDKVVETCSAVVEVTSSIKELMETTFSGPRAEKVLTLIENVGHLEWESDTKKYDLVKKMFTYDNEIDPVTQVMFLKIFDVISGIADCAEDTSNAIRLMISK